MLIEGRDMLIRVGIMLAAAIVAFLIVGIAAAQARVCTASEHAIWTTTGPDGVGYATWHPAVQPANRPGAGCQHGHEHGRNPGTCQANRVQPPFGYANAVALQPEPHTGFKVLCLNRGEVTDDGTLSPHDYRLVVHMGTSGVGRYAQPFHSVQYDFVARDGSGRYARIHGMADFQPTAVVGSTCDEPRRGGRDFSTLGCWDAYEIWTGGQFQIKHPDDLYQGVTEARLSIQVQPAVFDPITTRDPVNPTRLIYTCTVKPDAAGRFCTDALSAQAWAQGCRREFYGGPVYMVNQGQPPTYYTDAYGWVQPGPGPGTIRQEVSGVTNTDFEQYKLRQDFCGSGIHAQN